MRDIDIVNSTKPRGKGFESRITKLIDEQLDVRNKQTVKKESVNKGSIEEEKKKIS